MATDKDVSQSHRRPLRFTEIQDRLSEGVRDLIQLYHVFTENEENEVDEGYEGYKKHKEVFLPIMKKLFKRVTREEFEFNEKAYAFVKGNRQISIGKRQIRSFVHRMEELRWNIWQLGAVYHFSPQKWIDRIETTIEVPEPHITSGGFRLGRYVGPILEPISSKLEGLINENVIESLRKQRRQSIEGSINQKKSGQAKENRKSFNISSVHRRVYRVKAVTDFGDQLLKTHPYENLFNEVPSINFDNWTTFIQIVRSVLVNYHLVFGNFERIKVCEQCKKLFFEKRAGRKRFCSKDCQRKFKQASPKYMCWNRQTAWIRREVDKVRGQVKLWRFRYDGIPEYDPKPKSVSINHDCEGCATCIIGEKCPTLKKKNEKLLSVQQKLPAIQKEFSDRRIKKKDVVDKLKRLLIGSE